MNWRQRIRQLVAGPAPAPKAPAYVAVILQRWHDMTGKDPVLVDE